MKKKLLIIYSRDGMANSLRVNQIKKAVEKVGIRVELFDSTSFFNDFYQKKSQENWWTWLKYHLRFLKPLCYFSAEYRLAQKYPFLGKLRQRAMLIARHKSFITSHIIMTPSTFEMMSLLKKYPWQKIVYDAQTCFVDEIKLENFHSGAEEMRLLAKYEKKVLENADVVTFGWPSIKNFLIKKYNPSFKQVVEANWGCLFREKVSALTEEVKIVFIGNTSNYWTASEELVELVKNSKYKVDIFGKLKNKSIQSLDSYLGYLSQDKIYKISNYQFGLITLSQDKLRKETFSAKHLSYFSFGLPVLCPEWRKDPLLAPGTIYYRPENFDQVVAQYSQPDLWKKKHRAALEIARKSLWSNQLRSLAEEIKSL